MKPYLGNPLVYQLSGLRILKWTGIEKNLLDKVLNEPGFESF